MKKITLVDVVERVESVSSALKRHDLKYFHRLCLPAGWPPSSWHSASCLAIVDP